MTSNSIIDSIRERLDIADIVRDYIPSLKKAGRNYTALCPFHNEKTPSFSVSPEKKIFYCFGCGEHGDMFTFVMKIEGLTFIEAAQKLAQKAGVPWKDENYASVSANEKEKIELKKALKAASDFYSKFLFSSSAAHALKYLESRKISRHSLEKFSIGFSPAQGSVLTEELAKKGFLKERLIKAGLAFIRENGQAMDYFRGRIVFPIKNTLGDVIGLGGRVLDDSQPKYLNSPDTPLFSKRRVLYGLFESLPAIRKEGKILILEGYMDVMAAHQHGISNAAAPLGTAFSQEHAVLIKRYSKDAVLMFDPDEAGETAAVKAGEILIESGIYPRLACLETNLDPDDFLQKRGKTEFEKLIAGAADLMTFRINLILKKTGGKLSARQKSLAAGFLIETLLKQPNEVIKSEWVKMISQRLGIEQEAILLEMNKKRPGGQAVAPHGAGAVKPEDEIPAIEKGVIQLLLKNPKFIECAQELTDEDLQSEFSRKMFNAIRDFSNDSPDAIVAKLVRSYPQYSESILKLSIEAMEDDIHPGVFVKSVEMLKKFSKQRKLKELKQNAQNMSPEKLEEFSKLAIELKGKQAEDYGAD